MNLLDFHEIQGIYLLEYGILASQEEIYLIISHFVCIKNVPFCLIKHRATKGYEGA